MTSRMCHTASVVVSGDHCRARPSGDPSAGIEMKTSRICCPLALYTPRLMLVPAQLRNSWTNRLGSGLSCDVLAAGSYYWHGVFAHTMVRPLIPMIESNHGSRGSSGLLLRSTWKPYVSDAPPCFWACGSESRREINLLRAPNIFAMVISFLSLTSTQLDMLIIHGGLCAFCLSNSSPCLSPEEASYAAIITISCL